MPYFDTLFFRYIGAGGIVSLVSELLLTIFVVVVTGLDVYKIIRKRKEYVFAY